MKKAKTEKLRLEWVDPGTLTDNPANWRRHPDGQMQALQDVLADPEIGWAGVLLFNERTGRLIDGHARKKAAIARGEAMVPVLVGSWSEAAEKKILLTLDPLAGMALADEEMLSQLLAEVDFGESEPLRDLLEQLVPDVQAGADVAGGDPRPGMAKRGPVAKVKVVLVVSDLVAVERALVLTGELNRGDALAAICREYTKRQLDTGA